MAFANRAMFPQELIDMVIDNLYPDKSALVQTSLVASSWLPRSRLHKFRHIAVKGSDLEHRFKQFLEMLRANPIIGKNVQHLVLHGDYDTSSVHCFSLPPSLSPRLLANIVRRLPSLRTVQLHDVSFRGGILPPIGYKPIDLDELTLMHCGSTSDTTSDVLATLGLFANVGFLHMMAIAQDIDPEDGMDGLSDEGDWDEEDLDARNSSGNEGEASQVDNGTEEGSAVPTARPSSGFPRHLRVTSLKLEDAASDLYLEALSKSASIETLRWAEVECSALEDTVALAALLRKTGPRMEHLAMDLTQYLTIECFPNEDSEEIIVPDTEALIEAMQPGLSSCTSVSSFRITVPFSPPISGTTYHSMTWDCLLSALKSVPSTVQCVNVELSADGWACALKKLDVDWSRLNDVWKRFDSLSSVTFETTPGGEWCFSKEDRDFLDMQLAELREKEIFQLRG